MIVSLSLGDEVTVTLDDELDTYSPTRTYEMVAEALKLLDGVLVVCKSRRSWR